MCAAAGTWHNRTADGCRHAVRFGRAAPEELKGTFWMWPRGDLDHNPTVVLRTKLDLR